MNIDDYLEFNKEEKEKIEQFKIELKECKLKSVFFVLLKNCQWDEIIKLLDKKIKFYELTQTSEIFNKVMTDVSNSLFNSENIINNIHTIEKKEHFFIKQILAKNVVTNIVERQEHIKIINQEPFYKETINLGKKLLIENPTLVNIYNEVTIQEIKIIKNMLQLDEKLPTKHQSNKKVKL